MLFERNAFNTIALFLCAAVAMWAQTERGNITGQVKDPSGAAIPAAEVVAVHMATNVRTTAQSTSAGEYNIPVPPGVYRVTVTAAGFKR